MKLVSKIHREVRVFVVNASVKKIKNSNFFLNFAHFFSTCLQMQNLHDEHHYDVRNQKKAFASFVLYIKTHRRELDAFLNTNNRLEHIRQLRILWMKKNKRSQDFDRMKTHYPSMKHIPNLELDRLWKNYLRFERQVLATIQEDAAS